MYSLDDPAVVAVMRAPPLNPVEREDFTNQVSPGYEAPCRMCRLWAFDSGYLILQTFIL